NTEAAVALKDEFVKTEVPVMSCPSYLSLDSKSIRRPFNGLQDAISYTISGSMLMLLYWLEKF
ncbi:hypothetical protein P7K49_032491, partial [Saguinus oedipus]